KPGRGNSSGTSAYGSGETLPNGDKLPLRLSFGYAPNLVGCGVADGVVSDALLPTRRRPRNRSARNSRTAMSDLPRAAGQSGRPRPFQSGIGLARSQQRTCLKARFTRRKSAFESCLEKGNAADRTAAGAGGGDSTPLDRGRGAVAR